VVFTVNEDSARGGSDRALQRVETLACQIAETINAGEVESRERLRDAAINLLRDGVQLSEPRVQAASQPAGSFNPFAIGIPFMLMGAVLVFLFPLVGLLMFAAAGLTIAWGVGTTLLTRN
jgi:hypothetical protein